MNDNTSMQLRAFNTMRGDDDDDDDDDYDDMMASPCWE